ncbi:MAG: hypothetical protein IJK06_07805 [Clostridia bacterium]|nr:hypothetical protein [Clostridia bacterium]
MISRTPRNRQTRNVILHYMVSFAMEQGRQPSVREIGEAAGLMSTSTTAGYLNRMVNEGLLEKIPQRRRNYIVTTSGAALVKKAG